MESHGRIRGSQLAIHSRGRGGAVLKGLVAVMWLGAVTFAEAQDVPASLLLAAETRPIEFAMALRHADVLVGIEVPAADRIPQRMPNFALTYDKTVALSEVVNRFNQSHPGHQAALVDGVVVVRPRDRRADYLDQPFNSANQTVINGALLAVRTVFSALDAALASEEPTVGSRFVGAEEAGENVRITLAPQATVLQALNDIASQARQGWIVVTMPSAKDPRRPDVTQVGLLHHRGAMSIVPVRRRQ